MEVVLHRVRAEEMVHALIAFTAFPRHHKRIYCFLERPREIGKIAVTLNLKPRDIEEIANDLLVSGYIGKTFENRKGLYMNAPLLKESFSMVKDPDAFADTFYRKYLFPNSPPEVAALFARTDMDRQRTSLMATIKKVVDAIWAGEHIAPTLAALGRVHTLRGVKPEHYQLVGAALLATFADVLGASWTPAMQEAWAEAYEIVSASMQGGAQ